MGRVSRGGRPNTNDGVDRVGAFGYTHTRFARCKVSPGSGKGFPPAYLIRPSTLFTSTLRGFAADGQKGTTGKEHLLNVEEFDAESNLGWGR